MSLYEVAKDAFKLAQKSNDVELIQKILDVQNEALALQERQQAQHQRILELEDEVRSQKERLDERGKFHLDKGVYWSIKDTSLDQPFCPVCYSRGRLIPLKKGWDGYPKERSPWFCPDTACKSTYNPWDFKESADGFVM